MKKPIFTITIVFITLLLSAIAFAEGLKSGSQAPSFVLQSGSDNELTMDNLRGKIITIFYETRDVIKINRYLKDELNSLYDAQPEKVQKLIFRLPIINCKDAFWPVKRIWKSQLREYTKKEGIEIYGDWNGKMADDYMMVENKSNFLIVNDKGTIVYVTSGKIGHEETNKIKKLLIEITSEIIAESTK